jgi:hypothetical protein
MWSRLIIVYVPRFMSLLRRVSLRCCCTAGSLCVSSIQTGRTIARASSTASASASTGLGGTGPPAARVCSEAFRALHDVTALHYNEDANEIYTGSALGGLHVWSCHGGVQMAASPTKASPTVLAAFFDTGSSVPEEEEQEEKEEEEEQSRVG